MSMTKATEASVIGPTERGEIEAQIFDLMEKGATDPQIVRVTHVPIALVRELRAATKPQAAGMLVSGLQQRSDRRLCKCGGFQTEHVKGEGTCARTFCTAFEAAEDE